MYDVNYYEIIGNLIVNILRVLLIKKVMDNFLCAKDYDGKVWKISYGIYYLLTVASYSIFNVSAAFEICNLLGILGLAILYEDAWKKKIWISCAVLSMDMGCSLAVYFAFSKEMSMQQLAVWVLFLLICVTVISHIACPKEDEKWGFDRKQTLLLLMITFTSVLVLVFLLYGDFTGSVVALICVAIVIINLCVFYLYHVLLENYVQLREQEIYKQQTYAYQNQLEVIMESQSRIRALKHDMKNHILTLQALSQKGEPEELREYLNSMGEFMVNPAEYAATGNDEIDSLLNYKIQRAKEILKVVEVKIAVPEQMKLHTFDLNVVLGNLLDNGIEASAKTEEQLLRLTLRLQKGVLFIHITNSCAGVEEGEYHSLETTKKDRRSHGIGLGNVHRIVEKYHGDMELICRNNRMETDIMMYVEEL